MASSDDQAKRGREDALSIESSEESDDDFEQHEAAAKKPRAASLKNMVVTSVSVLVYKETDACSFYLNTKDLKAIVESKGGIWRDAINSKCVPS